MIPVLPLHEPTRLDDFPVASAGVSEAALFRGYGEAGLTTETRWEEDCACGEAVVLQPGEDLLRVYALHVRQRAHRRWSDATRWA